jgi:predicted MPP superfamily phosphohydrolase
MMPMRSLLLCQCRWASGVPEVRRVIVVALNQHHILAAPLCMECLAPYIRRRMSSEAPISSAVAPQPSPRIEGHRLIPDRPGPIVQVRSAKGFEWNRLDVPIAGLAPALDQLRMLHFTDLHARAWWDPAYDDLITRVRADPPDLILFTGDFVESKRDHRSAIPIVHRLFDSLTSRLGTFAILGNHDGDLVAPKLLPTNLTLIDRRRLCLESDDATLELIGLPGVDRKDLDVPFWRKLEPKAPGSARIVLSHFPDALPDVSFLRSDLFLAGHTHGGQICPPSRLPIIRHSRMPRRLCTGIHRVYDTLLVCNRGIGFSSRLQVRTFCPAEVIEIRLLQAPAASNS